jgi:hypothetical protein
VVTQGLADAADEETKLELHRIGPCTCGAALTEGDGVQVRHRDVTLSKAVACVSSDPNPAHGAREVSTGLTGFGKLPWLKQDLHISQYPPYSCKHTGDGVTLSGAP